MLNFLENMKNWVIRAFIVVAAVCAGVALIGGLFFELDPSIVASWFVLVVVVGLIGAFLVAFVAFLIWFLIENPSFVVFALIAVAIIVAGVALFISTDINVLATVGDTVKGFFAWLN